ncbi:hypothetical protein [Clostridium uliginosum]|uniref:Uncharacterized protein n=1 Tax=Clostridium uliginosum TaxID=119641 RepID=A0A1I1LXA2_9CLOT|nr:hypothetical protein [Clostridium uliginosum]SFC77744.1 hypothetical protein SAMN05421842_10975 [Clostridium uliginosum]
MGKCPFWSTGKEHHQCYDSCPMLESSLELEEEQCIFKEYLLISRMSFKDVTKEDYSFLKNTIYNNIEY